ncbi:hypothetical protein [Piscinibacter sp. HJYY11]|uniref:hypothetical protein n=1 Tax=Piscinibacter sp. HJYY11 TaxID=2801333 RepID=UPI00191F2D11|nr:hypothetical protein [Piscinibacter sp. HJYY11]MBL0726240.1 hypothetical protein [Piscinibacter sp. HJYY11]
MSTATLPVRIVHKTTEADGIISLLLAPEGPLPLPAYLAGTDHVGAAVIQPAGMRKTGLGLGGHSSALLDRQQTVSSSPSK